MADIFISYSHKDRAWVKRLVDALTAQEYKVWWDLEIRAGESFDQVIETTLEQVRCVVVVWSQYSVKSEWVRAESAWAKDRNRLVSIRIDEDLALPLKFYHVHTESMVGWKGSRNAPVFHKLVADIRKIAGLPPAPVQSFGAKAPSAPTAESKPAPAVQTKPEPLPSLKAASAPRAETKTSPEPGPHSTAPKQPFTFGRRGIVVGMIALAGAVLIGGIFYIGNMEKADLGDRPEGPDVGQDQGAPVPLSFFRDSLKDGFDGPEMVVIPRGKFQMGCVSSKGCQDHELPVHTVTFDKPFAIGRYEVTFAEYDRFAEATGAKKPDDEGWGRGHRPVIKVSWGDAAKYAEWLSQQTGKRYRLPGEAEWEYALRAETKTPFWTGDCIHTDQANYDGNYDYNNCGAKTGVYRKKTLPVGGLPANPWGLHEMHGNVWDWLQDCWHDSYAGAPGDGSIWSEEGGGGCRRRVIRGGSWLNRPSAIRSAFRSSFFTVPRDGILGFRLARDL